MTELKALTDNATMIAGESNTLLSKQQTENQQGHCGLEQHYQPTWPDISPDDSKNIYSSNTHKSNLVNLKGLKLSKAYSPSMIELS